MTAEIKEFPRPFDDRDAFRDIFENANIGIFQSTPDGHYMLVNPALAEMYGYESAEHLIKALTDIRHQLYVEEGRREVFINHLLTHGSLENFESQVYRRDGKVIWISETARVVSGPDDKGIYFEGFVKNITERKRLEAQVEEFTHDLEARVQKRTHELLLEVERRRLAENSLRHALKNAEAATEAKSRFLASMSHELRTPLNAIIGFADTIHAEIYGPIEPQEYGEYVEIIKSSGEHLLELINDVLDLSKIDSGNVDLDMDEIDVAHIMDECFDLIGHRAAEADVALKCDVPPAINTQVRGDARRIKQVVLNLLSNAIKFTPEGGQVTAYVTDMHPGVLTIAVKDTGVGIDKEDIPKVLSEYGQAEHGLEHAVEGTGLGLPISKKLVELHGGTLTMDSVVGKGTTVTVTLPL